MLRPISPRPPRGTIRMEPLRYFGGAINTSSCWGAVVCGARRELRRLPAEELAALEFLEFLEVLALFTFLTFFTLFVPLEEPLPLPREPPRAEPDASPTRVPRPPLRLEDFVFLEVVSALLGFSELTDFADFTSEVWGFSVRLAALLPRLCVVTVLVSSIAIS